MRVSGQLDTLPTLPQGKTQRYPTEQKAGWGLELVGMSWRREKSLGAFAKPAQLTSRLFYKKCQQMFTKIRSLYTTHDS
jgi:hypothetical protein